MTGRLVDFQEFDIRANTAVFLSQRTVRLDDNGRACAFQNLVLRYGAERGGMDDAPHVGGFLDLGVQQILQQSGNDTDNQAKDYAGRDA